jgi:hypothetical protein
MKPTQADITRRHGPATAARLKCVLTSVGYGFARFAHRTVDEMLQAGLHEELLHDTKNILKALEEEYVSTMGPPNILQGSPKASMDKAYIVVATFNDWDEGDY